MAQDFEYFDACDDDDFEGSPIDDYGYFDEDDSGLAGDFDYFGVDSYTPASSSVRRQRRTGSHWLLIAGGTAMLVVAAVIIGLVLRPPKGEEKPATVDVVAGTTSPAVAPSPTAGASPSHIPTRILSPSSFTLASIEAYYRYDANGNLGARIGPDGAITRYQYDPLDRLTSITYPDGSQVTYTYDELGRRTQMVDGLGTTTYNYDLLGRLTDVTDPNGNHVGYEYDPLGNLTALVYPDGSVVRYSYNVDGRLVGVTDVSGTTMYTYDEAGRLASRMLPNGVTTTYTYDAANRLVGISHANDAGQTLLAFEYALDEIGNRTQVVQTTDAGEQLVTQYRYDSLSRLTGVTCSDGREVVYTYDKVGNRLTMTTSEGETQYSYNDLNQLVSLTAPDGLVTTFQYDENGNLIERMAPGGTTRYAYDYENRLVRVDDGKTVVQFIYDGDGNRVAKVVDGVQTEYVNHVNGPLPQVLLERSAGRELRYVGGSRLLAQTDATTGEALYLLEDSLGSTMALAGRDGVLAATFQYDAFGTVSPTGSVESPYGFTGERYDPETGLLYLRARYYDPHLGRFTSGDIFPGLLGNPQSQNGYVYVENNPVNLSDPLGLNGTDPWWRRLPGSQYGQQALQYYASLLDRPGLTWYQRTGAWTGGFFAALWTPETAWKTSLVLGGGYAAGTVAGATTLGQAAIVKGTLLGSRFEPFHLPLIGKFVHYGIGRFGPHIGAGLGSRAFIHLYSTHLNIGGARGLDIPIQYIHGLALYLSQLSGPTSFQSISVDLEGLDNQQRYYPPFPPGGGGGDIGVGGVSLDRAAEVLVDLNDITGATYDPATGQLILIGRQDLSLPPMNLDDLVVAIRSVYAGEDPGVTMVPVDPSMRDITQRVEYFGQVENTYFGWVMFEADRYLKGLAAGQDTLTGEPITPNVPGFKSELELSFEQRTATPWHRNWFIPGEIILRQAADGRSMVFDQVTIQLESRFIQFQPDGSHIDIPGSSPVTDQFTAFITEHYDQFAAEKAELAELVRLAKIVGVVRWLRDNNIPVDLSWVDGYQVKYVETPRTTPGVVAEMSTPDGSYKITSFGGVDFSTENTYLEDDEGEAVTLREQALASRPTDTPVTWTFEQDGETYTAVALNLAPAEVIGGYTAAVTDLALPVSGGMLASFTRYYNSLNLADGAMGPGWSFMPYRLGIQETPIPVSETQYQIEQRATLAMGTQWTIFEGPYQTSVGETILLPETPSGAYRDVLLQPDGIFVVRRRDGTKLFFDSKGRLLFIVGRNGNRLRYFYDKTYPDRLVSIAGAADDGITLQYDDAGRLTDILAANGQAVRYTYDAGGRLVGVADDTGPLVSYVYDENDLLIEVRDGGDRALLRNSYDGLGRLLAQTNATDYGIGTTYVPGTGQVTHTDSDGRQATLIYQDGQLLAQTDPLNHSTSFEYDPAGNLSSVTDPRGNTSHFGYDDYGNLVSIETPMGDRMHLFYDAEARPVWVIGPNHRLAIYEYDDSENLTRVTDGLLVTSLDSDRNLRYDPTEASSTEFDYDADGNLSALTDATGSATRMSYDSLGNLAAIQLPSGGVVRQSYDERSRLTSLTDPLGHEVKFGYDARDNLTHVTTAAGTTQYTYDDQSNLIRVVDALGNTTSYDYDALGNLVKVTEPNGAVTQYEYDDRRNLTRVVDANNNVTVYSYDERGQLVLVAHEDWPAVQFVGILPEDDPTVLAPVEMMLREAVTLATFDRIVVELETGTALGVSEAGDIHFISRKSGTTLLEPLGQLESVLPAADLERMLQVVAAIDDGKLAMGLIPVRDTGDPAGSPRNYVWIGPDKKVLALPESLLGLANDWPDRAAGAPGEMELWLQGNQAAVGALRAFLFQLVSATSLEYTVEEGQNLRDVVQHAYGLDPDLHPEEQIAQVVSNVRQANGLRDPDTLPVGATLRLEVVDLGEYGLLMPVPAGQFLYLDAPAQWADLLDFYLGGNRTIHVSRYSAIAEAERKIAQEKPITLDDVAILFSAHSSADSTETESQAQAFAQLIQEFPEVQSAAIDVTGDPQGAQICLDSIAADATTVINIEHTTAGGRAQIRDDGSFSARDIKSARGSTSYLNCNSVACSFGDATIRAGGETAVGTTQQVTLSDNMAFVREFLTVLRQHPEGITPSEAYYLVKIKLRLQRIRGYIEQALTPHEWLLTGAGDAVPRL